MDVGLGSEDKWAHHLSFLLILGTILRMMRHVIQDFLGFGVGLVGEVQPIF